MEKRELGRTGEMLSVVGFGGIIVMDEAPADASRHVAEAVERGVNYFDVAPAYGNAEERLGPALEPYRSSVFLACKTGKRTRDEAAAELEESLRRLKTDHFDLYQFHALESVEEARQILGPGGAAEAVLEARDKGLVRYIGFSAHNEDAALTMLDGLDVDSILFPLNLYCWHGGGFGPRVLERARDKGIGILALKALALRAYRKDEPKARPRCWYHPVLTPEQAAIGLRFTLSLPITAAVSPGDIELFRWACDAADSLTPLPEPEAAEHAARMEGEPLFRA
jgi:aryl-alcohol dehydrogenase-like predicted oxidoreductase